LIIGHFIATTASIWTAQPILCAGPWAIHSGRLLEYTPGDECHANHRDFTKIKAIFFARMSKVLLAQRTKLSAMDLRVAA